MEETNKLPVEFKTKWLDALRSGKFKQGQGLLYDNKTDEYCCLGVACKIALPDNDPPENEFIDAEKYDVGEVPKIIIGNSGIPIVLSEMNDGVCGNGITQSTIAGKNFIEIADWIEKNL